MGHVHPTAIIGDPPEHRDFIANPGFETFPPDVDPTAVVNSFATIDAGCWEPTRVGARTLLMTKTHVGHDAQVGADCELAPGVVICGHVELGDRVRIGVNACVRPGIKVGDGARIGAGAVVVKDVPPGATVVGNPARPLSEVIDRRAAEDAWAIRR
jgi:UDP-N-acetylglucosamine acyltransferase